MRKFKFESYWGIQSVGAMHPIFYAISVKTHVMFNKIPLLGFKLTLDPYSFWIAILGFGLWIPGEAIPFTYRMFDILSSEGAKCTVCQEPANDNWRVIMSSSLAPDRSFALHYCSQAHRDEWKEYYYRLDYKSQREGMRTMLMSMGLE